MDAEEKQRLLNVLYQVQSLSGRIAGVAGTFSAAKERVKENCEIDGEGPKVGELDGMIGEAQSTISSFQNHVIPNLIYRINS